MADDANVTITATVLPDEIQKTFISTMTVSPADGNDKWYYKLSSVDNTSSDLMAGYYTDYTAVDSSTAPTAVATADKVNFLFVKNTDSAESVYIVLDGGTASSSAADGITLGPTESLALRLPNATVADIHAISSAGTVECIVCALLDDVA
jgi:FtsP/CotA-like multicopper oxidase with cupredoxin domain